MKETTITFIAQSPKPSQTANITPPNEATVDGGIATLFVGVLGVLLSVIMGIRAERLKRELANSGQNYQEKLQELQIKHEKELQEQQEQYDRQKNEIATKQKFLDDLIREVETKNIKDILCSPEVERLKTYISKEETETLDKLKREADQKLQNPHDFSYPPSQIVRAVFSYNNPEQQESHQARNDQVADERRQQWLQEIKAPLKAYITDKALKLRNDWGLL